MSKKQPTFETSSGLRRKPDHLPIVLYPRNMMNARYKYGSGWVKNVLDAMCNNYGYLKVPGIYLQKIGNRLLFAHK